MKYPKMNNSGKTNVRHCYQLKAFLIIWLSVQILSACASITQSQPGAKQVSAKQVSSTQAEPGINTHDEPAEGKSALINGWWQVGFHREYNEDDDVQWQYDSFIAHEIFQPIIKDDQGLKLWRFHRRAAVDDSAHKFSFIFYATRQVAETIYQHVNEHPVIKELLKNNFIDRLSFYDINQPIRPKIETTSDPDWPLELQKTWPYFIMGVSRTWLGLVEHYYGELDFDDDAGFANQLEAFKQVNAKIDLLWKNNGSHAFLHHLNALFAYEELYIIERRLTRF